LSANGSICIRITPEILREGAIQIIVAEAGSGEAGGAAATPGRSEPCFACRTSRFGFLRRPIFLPNKTSCKDKKPTPRLFRLFESRPSVKVSDLIGGTFFFVKSINV
jgi:hypothetical protein